MDLPIRNARLRLSAGQVFWREVGAGNPVVFLHGTWADSEQWVPLLQVLGDRHHTLAPDLLGFGESFAEKTRYSIDLEVDVLAEWLDSLGLSSVVLVAEGLGGWVAAQFALRFPERVRGLVLLAPEGARMDPGRWRWDRWLVGRVPVLGWIVQALAPIAKLVGWRWLLRRLAWRRQLRQFPAACQILFLRRSRDIQAEQVGDRLPWLKVPIAILQGEAATDPTVLALNRSYRDAPMAEVHEVPGGDDPLVAGREAIAHQIQAFIAAHSA